MKLNIGGRVSENSTICNIITNGIDFTPFVNALWASAFISSSKDKWSKPYDYTMWKDVFNLERLWHIHNGNFHNTRKVLTTKKIQSK